MTVEQIFGLYNYWIVIFLMMTGFYIVISSSNLIKTVIGLNIFQTSVFLLYITMGKITGGTAPILPELHHDDHHAAATDHEVDHHRGPSARDPQDDKQHADQHADEHGSADTDHDPSTEKHLADHSEEPLYSNPLPSVLMLTAIVVGIATTALALALFVRIREDYGSIEEDDILEIDRAAS